MARFSTIVLAYFVIGAVMIGGGAVAFDDAGVAQFFVDDGPNGIAPNSDTVQNLDGIGGALQSIVDQFAGPIVLIWNLVVGLLTYLNWPVVVLATNGAPPMATLLLGGSLTVAFYGSVIRLVRTSA